jgi:hypothetical protein
VLRFVLKFGFLLALFYGLLATPYFDRMLYSYLEANAWLSNAILNGFGQHTQVSEVTIESPQFAIAIRRGCDAVEPTGSFVQRSFHSGRLSFANCSAYWREPFSCSCSI